MSTLMIEGALDVLRAYFLAQGSTKIDALNSAYAAGDTARDGAAITLAHWVGVHIAEVVEGDTFPYVEILPARATIAAENRTHLTQQFDFVIYCWVQDPQDNTERLRRRGLRYARAIAELIMASRDDATFSGYTCSKPSPLDYGPLRWTRNKSRVVTHVGVGLSITATETKP